MLAATIVILAAWLAVLLLTLHGGRRIRHLGELPPQLQHETRLSVVIAARNEAEYIEAALGSVLQLDFPDLEIIVVNDRSTDGTGDILERLALDHTRLQVIHVHELPDNWIGKNHALQRGLDAATGEFVLFTDADVHFAADALLRAVGHMQREQLDHLATAPRLLNARPSMRVMMSAFGVFFFIDTQPWQAGNPRSDKSIGIGAFNLMRRQTLLQAGGLQPFSLRPDDDIMLGRLLKRRGAKAEFVFSDALVAVQWYETAAQAIRGLEKNSFAYFDYRPFRTIVLGMLTLFITLMPLFGLLALPQLAGWLSLAASLAMFTLAALSAAAMKLGWGWGLALPLGTILLVFATFRSMVVTLKRGGIIWRDTFYPLHLLRRQRL